MRSLTIPLWNKGEKDDGNPFAAAADFTKGIAEDVAVAFQSSFFAPRDLVKPSSTKIATTMIPQPPRRCNVPLQEYAKRMIQTTSTNYQPPRKRRRFSDDDCDDNLYQDTTLLSALPRRRTTTQCRIMTDMTAPSLFDDACMELYH